MYEISRLTCSIAIWLMKHECMSDIIEACSLSSSPASHCPSLPSIHYCQFLSSTQPQLAIHNKHNSYPVNITVNALIGYHSLHTSVNSMTCADVHTRTRLMRDVINDDLWRLRLSPQWWLNDEVWNHHRNGRPPGSSHSSAGFCVPSLFTRLMRLRREKAEV